MVAMALVLAIILVQDIRKKSKGRFIYFHDSLQVVGKFLFLLGFYFLFVYDFIKLAHNNQKIQHTSKITSISTFVLVIPVVLISACRWRRWRNRCHISGNGPRNVILVEATDEFQDFTSCTAKAIAVGVTQIILLTYYIFAVAEDVKINFPTKTVDDDKWFFVAYILASVLQASYAVGVNDVFGNMYLQTYFWLEAFFTLNGRRSILQPVYVGPEMTEKELKDYDFDDNMKVPKIAILSRFFVSMVVNMFGDTFITIVLPLHLSLSDGPTDFVLNATAAYFISELDDLSESVKFWLSVEQPKTKKSNNRQKKEKGFEHEILYKNDKMGIEIRKYSGYNYVEYDSFPGMKIAMTGKTPLDKSHIITQAKVVGNNDELFEIINIKQPIEYCCDDDNDDNDGGGGEITSEHVVRVTKKKIIAVAKLSNPRFDCTIFNPCAGMSEILSHANRELRDVLKLRGFEVFVTPLLSSEGELVVFAKYNNAPSSSDNSGEVWIYLDDDDKEVKKLLLLSTTIGDTDTDDDTDDDDDDDSPSSSKKTIECTSYDKGNCKDENAAADIELDNTPLVLTREVASPDDGSMDANMI